MEGKQSLTSVSKATVRQSYGLNTCYQKQPAAPAAAVVHLTSAAERWGAKSKLAVGHYCQFSGWRKNQPEMLMFADSSADWSIHKH